MRRYPKMPPDFPNRVKHIRRLLRRQLGLRGSSLTDILPKSRRFLPRDVQAALSRLADGEQAMEHPRLRAILEADPLSAESKIVRKHLISVDVAHRRKGQWLGIIGAIVINLMCLGVGIALLLRWLG
jgi:hypothetical protein